MSTTVRQMSDAAWRHVCWLGAACLCLLVVACAITPLRSPLTSTASRPTQAAPITAYHGHTSTVYAVAWSPDGTRIASGGNDSTVQIWSAATGHRLVTYPGHLGTVYAVAWSPDGTRIASASDDATVQVWHATTGKRIKRYRGHATTVEAVVWSPQGTYLASGGWDKTVQVWHAEKGDKVTSYQGHTSWIRHG